MKRALCVVVWAALVLAVMSGASLAATISYSTSYAGSAIGPVSSWDSAFGTNQAIFWDITGGRPNYNSTASDNSAANPAYVSNFTYQNTVAGGGNGNGGGSSYTANGYGGGPGTTGVTYNLVMNKSMTFNFTALFYDATYSSDNGGLALGATALEVRLVDPSAAGTDEAWHAISVGQLEAGAFEQWYVQATAGDTIQTQVVWVNGEGVGAAGFFLDNVTVTDKSLAKGGINDPPATPEPATAGLLGFGLASLLAWRKKFFGSANEDRFSSDLCRLADI